MKIDVVYIVECGEYEDKILMCIHTNKNEAEACASIHNGYVSEYELDHQEGLKNG